MYPTIHNLTFAETPERLKITIPLPRNWLLWGLFSVSLLIWVGMALLIIIFLVRDVWTDWQRYSLVLTIMLLVWLVLWYYLGRIIWQRWQYYTADREILFINPETLIIRRPVSILGLTDAYDMKYVNPFYYHQKHHCAAFDYGSKHIYFAGHLSEADIRALAAFLNGRFFRHYDDEE